MTKRTIITNRVIAKCYAKLAKLHYDEAEKIARSGSASIAIDGTNERMTAVERYIEKAGGAAVESVFGKWW